MFGEGINLSLQTGNSARRKKLIIAADDFGLARGINEAVEKAHRDGVVTATSLIVNGRAFESAIEVLKRNPQLDAGLHLNLTEGCPVTPLDGIPSLANSSGFLYHHPFELLKALIRRRVRLIDLETEIGGQLRKVSASGVRVTHLDGHKHVHVVPQVFDVVCRMAPVYGIHAVRSTLERAPKLYSLIVRNAGAAGQVGQVLKQYVFGKTLSATFVMARSRNGHRTLSTPDRLYGITQTGFLDMPTFADMIKSLPNGVSELMCHPGYVDGELMRAPTRLHFQRERDLELLTRGETRDLLKQAGVELISYRELGK